MFWILFFDPFSRWIQIYNKIFKINHLASIAGIQSQGYSIMSHLLQPLGQNQKDKCLILDLSTYFDKNNKIPWNLRPII